MNYFTRRRLRNGLRHLLKEARHVRALREDVAGAADLEALDRSAAEARSVLRSRRWDQADRTAGDLAARTRALCPPRAWPWLRENAEVLVVALAVAMAFRTYFVQPFKIPTSSMSPTLKGIHFEPQSGPHWVDRTPLRLVRWLLLGAWYEEIRADASGTLRVAAVPDGHVFLINGRPRRIPESMAHHAADGESVIRGQLLASGARVAGDHIFVNKLAWNFRAPRRGEIMVFKTDGIVHPQIKTNEHYVKRMVGLPGDTLSVDPPFLRVRPAGGRPPETPPGIARVESARAGYDGYQALGDYLGRHTNCVALGPDEYFACGDNQRNSLDSRYWGPVRAGRLVGPACFIYWPLSRRWGLAR